MLILAHRGASRAAPENTPEAFRAADRMGSDGVELDVRLGPGGRLVVFHDPLPTDAGEVAELPDLRTALAACGERLLVNVEIKHDGGDGPVVADATIAALRAAGADHADRWLISSFSWEVVEHCRAADPSIPTAYLVVDSDAEVIERAAAAGHRALHPGVESLTADSVAACHAAGLAVTTWTCNDAERIVELAEIGVDGVCTDVPDVALAALGRIAPALTPRWGRPA